MKHLLDSRCIHKIEDGVKILSAVKFALMPLTESSLLTFFFTSRQGAETFTTPITIEVSRASQKAIEAIEKAGGSITTRYYNALALRATVHPEKFVKIPKFAAPLRKEDISKLLSNG